MTTESPVLRDDIEGILASELPWDQLARTSVLVTGAGGMLPSYVVRTLLALNDRHGAAVRVLGLVRDRHRAERVLGGLLDRDDFSLLVQDVCEPVVVDGPVDHVVHGASPARPALHTADPTGTIKANLLGTFNLLDLAVAKGARGFALMSSAEVYGARPADGGLVTEDDYGGFDILAPRACYSEGKRAAETICATYQHQYGVRCSIARFGHVYGPGMALDDGRVQADLAADVVAGRDITLHSDGSATRTYTYVADAVAGLFHILLKGERLAYNVADEGGLVSIRQLAEAFTEVRPEKRLSVKFAGQPPQVLHNPTRSQGLSSQALRALGWRPRVDLAEGLDRMISHYEHELGVGDVRPPV